MPDSENEYASCRNSMCTSASSLSAKSAAIPMTYDAGCIAKSSSGQ